MPGVLCCGLPTEGSSAGGGVERDIVHYVRRLNDSVLRDHPWCSKEAGSKASVSTSSVQTLFEDNKSSLFP